MYCPWTIQHTGNFHKFMEKFRADNLLANRRKSEDAFKAQVDEEMIVPGVGNLTPNPKSLNIRDQGYKLSYNSESLAQSSLQASNCLLCLITMSTYEAVLSKTLPKLSIPKRRNLNRGKACRNCRIRKNKCDGQSPSCSQCLRRSRGGAVVECVYEKVSQTRKQTLQETIQKLEARLHQLAGSVAEEDSVITQQSPTCHSNSPTITSDIEKQTGSYYEDSSFKIESLITSCGSCTSPFVNSSGEVSSFRDTVYELTSDPEMKLIQSFLPHAQSFGFFLDIPRFCQSAALALPLGHHDRPFPGLLSTLYLLGSFLSQPSPDLDTALCRALLHVANALSSPHPMHILHGIQAEILLAVYFFHTGRLMEGKYHINSAVSLTLSSGYHKLGSGISTQPEMSSPSESVPVVRRDDTILEEEKVQAFWMTFTLANCWGVVGGSMPNMVFECHGELIDTPWPRNDAGLEGSLGLIPTSSEGRMTVQSFLDRVVVMSTSLPAPSAMELYAKSSILLERATDVATSYCSDPLSDERRSFSKMFASLDSFIEDWAKELPPFLQTISTSPDAPLTLVTHTIINIATINLHAPFGTTNPVSRNKALVAARHCVELVRQAKLTIKTANGGSLVVNPFFGPMWTTVCQIFIEEIGRVSGASEEGLSSSPWGEEAPGSSGFLTKEELVGMLDEMFEVMEVIAMNCPLMKYQLYKLKSTYRLGS
ncbi:Zn(2)-Cys(6) binuclear cluster domain-containing protein [Lentinula guzmanii]|uniref:Zn(2)-Cys(6) binuclear cluster domain-containing protein n=1 Tax=Lentinula guzmanii TaxID=2804957 RepID=A0AA38J288_9AGAR|nr:Zn(2)-Cys(6) binuclear cluster domain-containing protein [Lentinula guzmanii]